MYIESLRCICHKPQANSRDILWEFQVWLFDPNDIIELVEARTVRYRDMLSCKIYIWAK